ncbi:unnamed protein product [Alopecurus aequalis]
MTKTSLVHALLQLTRRRFFYPTERMQSASAEGRNLDSPSAMDQGSAKKARLELSNGDVKQEVVVQEAADGEGGAGAGAGAVAEGDSRVEISVRLDIHVLQCPLCARPFKPPVLQCKCGQLACGGCVAALPDGRCETCKDGGGIFGPCPVMDAVVSAAKIACPHDGCGLFVVYHEAGEHKNACPHAPCHCTEPGCVGFAASPAALAGHLAADHAVPVRNFNYGKVNKLQVPLSVPRLLLVAEDDRRVFLLTMGALGDAGAGAVSVVCVRASAAARPSFTCKMWANLAPADGGKSDVVLVEMQVRSSTLPGAVFAADEPTFLAVPPAYLVPGPGDVPSMEVALSVRIDGPC